MNKSWERAKNRIKVDKLQGYGLGLGMLTTILGGLFTAGVLNSTADIECAPPPTEIQVEFKDAVICEAQEVPLSSEQKGALLLSVLTLGTGIAGMAAGASSVYTQRKLETPKP